MPPILARATAPVSLRPPRLLPSHGMEDRPPLPLPLLPRDLLPADLLDLLLPQAARLERADREGSVRRLRASPDRPLPALLSNHGHALCRPARPTLPAPRETP